MKSTTLTILATVGVLALASAAMVVNADTLSSIGTGAIGGASEVLIPASTDTPTRAVPATAAPTSPATPAASHAPSGTVVPSSSDDDSSRNGGASESDEHEEHEDGDDD